MKITNYILILILLSKVALAQFSIPDTIVKRGDVFTLPIEWTGISSDSNFYDFKLKFDLRMIEVISTEVLSPSLDGSSFNVEINLNENPNSFIKFTGSSNEEFRAVLVLEALAGPDSITRLVIDSLNGTQLLNPTVSEIFIDNPISFTQNNSIGEPYPNPFDNRFSLELEIFEETILEVSLFNTAGKLVGNDRTIPGVKMKLFDSNFSEVEFGNLEPNSYRIEVEVDRNVFSNGYYYIGVRLGNEIIYKPVVIAN